MFMGFAILNFFLYGSFSTFELNMDKELHDNSLWVFITMGDTFHITHSHLIYCLDTVV